MVELIGRIEPTLAVYAVHFQRGCLDDLPWKDEECDCVVWLTDPNFTDHDLLDIAFALAKTNNDWIQVAGHRCEELHDAIDRTAVTIGRQRQVGDGQPMTYWHNDVQSIPELTELVQLHYGQNDIVLVIVVGCAGEFEAVSKALRESLF